MKENRRRPLPSGRRRVTRSDNRVSVRRVLLPHHSSAGVLSQRHPSATVDMVRVMFRVEFEQQGFILGTNALTRLQF